MSIYYARVCVFCFCPRLINEFRYIHNTYIYSVGGGFCFFLFVLFENSSAQKIRRVLVYIILSCGTGETKKKKTNDNTCQHMFEFINRPIYILLHICINIIIILYTIEVVCVRSHRDLNNNIILLLYILCVPRTGERRSFNKSKPTYYRHSIYEYNNIYTQ